MPSTPKAKTAKRPKSTRKTRNSNSQTQRGTPPDAGAPTSHEESALAQQVDVATIVAPTGLSQASAPTEATPSDVAGGRSTSKQRASGPHRTTARSSRSVQRTENAEGATAPDGAASRPVSGEDAPAVAADSPGVQNKRSARARGSATRRGKKRTARRSGADSGDAPAATDIDVAGESTEALERYTHAAEPEANSITASVDSSAKRPRQNAKRNRRNGRKPSSSPATDSAIHQDSTALEEVDDARDSQRNRTSKQAIVPSRTMLINVSAGDECRIAIIQDGRMEELFIERVSAQSHVGNIYKGRVINVEPSIQAAFVDFGLSKNGFLHISDVQPQYFPAYSGEPEEVGRKIPRRDRPPIQDCFRRGQEVICQVIKEGVGTKGPTLTTYLSIPGRFLVMMPGMSRHGVSRKIEDDETRRQMRDMMTELSLPSGIGFIMRTAGQGQTKRDLQRDLNYLQRLWKTVVGRVQKLDTPAELYQESDLVTRTIRDLYTSEFSRVVVDDAEAAQRAREFLQLAMPRSKTDVELYSGREPLFHRFGIEDEIERINLREVPLPSGGSIVIESTEAMVAIDVNSGRFRASGDAEEMAYQLNLEAAEEIARQLRLRDLGGLVVCDFIDMRLDRHKRAVERAIRDALKSHRERARVLRMSAFGLIEITRQRRGPSMKRHTFFECQHCKGTGLVKMPESVVLDIMRIIQRAAHQDHIQTISVTTSIDVAHQILNRKRSLLGEIEAASGKELIVRGDSGFVPDLVEYTFMDARGHPAPLGDATTRKASR